MDGSDATVDFGLTEDEQERITAEAINASTTHPKWSGCCKLCGAADTINPNELYQAVLVFRPDMERKD